MQNNTQYTLDNLTIAGRFNMIKEDFDNVLTGAIDFRDTHTTFIPRNGHTEVTLNLSKQFMVENLTDILAERIGMYVLHAERTIDKKCWNVTGFTKPSLRQMYLVYINTASFGIVDDMTIDIYDSLEIMFARIRQLYFSFEENMGSSRQIHVLERMKAKEIWDIFHQ